MFAKKEVVFVLVLIILVSIMPYVSGGAYGAKSYGKGAFGVGEVETAPAGSISGEATGGGAGGRKAVDLEIDQDIIKVFVKVGDALKRPVRISNTGTSTLEVSITPSDTLKDILLLPESDFILKAGEERDYEINIFAREGTAPGVYVGNILVKAGSLVRLIKAVIEVESEKVLFDISLDIPIAYKTINPGDELEVQATLLSLGGIRDANVEVSYVIKNIEGETILEEKEVIKLGKQASFNKRFLLPENIEFGEYTFAAIVRYGDSIGTSTESFTVGRKKFPIRDLMIFAGVLIIIALTILLHKRQLKHIESLQGNRLEKLAEKKHSLSELKLNKKLEKEMRLLEKAFSSGYITKGAYEKARKKIEKLGK